MMHRERAYPPDLWLALAGSTAVVVIALHYSRLYSGNIVDDALISLEYAKNIGLGHGAVFNPGERVEGYTNFLWIALLVPVFEASRWLGGDFVRASVLTSTLLAAFDVGLVFLVGRQLWGGKRGALAAGLCAVGLCVVDNSYVVWAMLAMENHLVVFWMLLCVHLRGTSVRHREIWIGLVLAALQMTRPDAALFSVAFVGSELAGVRERAALFRIVKLAAVAVAAYATYFAWRFAYYGFPLPNTYYVRLGGASFDGWGRGLDYVAEFLRARGYVPLLALGAARFLREPAIRTLYVWSILHVAYVVYVGGDFYPGQRFLVPLIPALGLLMGRGVAGLVDSIAWRRVAPASVAAVSLGLAVVALLGIERGPGKTEVERWGSAVEQQHQGVLWLAQHAPPGSSIFEGRIGSMGFYTPLYVHDFFGIIDPTIAHGETVTLGRGKAGHEKRASLAYVLSKKPTYVVARYLPDDDLRPHGYALDMSIPLQGGLWVRTAAPASVTP